VLRLSYVTVLVACLIGTAWLEIVLHARVYRRWRRLLLTIVLVIPAFIVWDLYAIARGHWWFDTERITGVFLGGGLPLDEVLFFIVIPILAVLTYEAVRSVKSRWPAGDEVQR
jgi:lycopene cyclase domain-containing protein